MEGPRSFLFRMRGFPEYCCGVVVAEDFLSIFSFLVPLVQRAASVQDNPFPQAQVFIFLLWALPAPHFASLDFMI